MVEKKEFPTLMEIKQKIPKEYYESSAMTSMYYTIRALFNAGLLMYGLYWCRSLITNVYLDILVCSVYIFLQGIIFWGFFTIGHDCGHSSFSRYHSLNFVVGCVMHSLILTPYESWRVTHRHHHKNTGNIDKDEIFYPQRKSESYLPTRQSLYALGVAWFLYLVCGFPPRKVQHFNPWEALFSRSVLSVMVSIASWMSVFSLSVGLSMTFGFGTLVLYYYAPIFVFATMLVIVTFLHHNDEATPWYGDSQWTYVKGNLSSVDRDYGWLINNLSHNIGTHQIHHLFPIIPHYNLNEATAYFRAAYPDLVRENKESILYSFWKTAQLYIKYGTVDDGVEHYSFKHAISQEDVVKAKAH